MMAAKTLSRGGAVALSMILVACGGGGGSGSTNADTTPSISSQPSDTTVFNGATASFAVAASGNGLSYQWLRNGAPIAGATEDHYTTPPIDAADGAGQYAVVVSNSAGSVTSVVATLNLVLSPAQQAYEDVALTGAGSFQLHWNLNLSGPETDGVNYAYSDVGRLLASPLTAGPQTMQATAPLNLTRTPLSLPTITPRRVLKDGTILVVPAAEGKFVVSYVGADLKVDTLAADGVTVAYTALRGGHDYVALSGNVSATPVEMARWFNSFFANPAILDTARSYTAGAGYLKYSETSAGDRYYAFDCAATTSDANVSPCVTGSSLATALGNGIQSASDGTTYHMADGTTSAVGGVQVWVASAARPASTNLSNTEQYRIYFELNGNVYTGVFVKNGTPVNGGYYVSNLGGATLADSLTFFPYHIRLNQAARDSLKAAMKI